jgi:GT2 family glycosyltransferase
MNIIAIITTYGNRFHFLNKVINRLLKEKIKKLLIISNGSNEHTKKLILNTNKNKKIKLIILKKNYGSAFAIKKGLKYSLKSNFKFVLLLDDDNLPALGFKKILERKYQQYGNSFKNIFSPNRYKLKYYKNLQSKNNQFFFFNNNFIKFNFLQIIFHFIKKFFIKKEKLKKNILMQVAPYGGLFFNKEVIKSVGYPKTNFFSYADDFDFTLRMTRNNFNIYYCKDYLIEDLDKTLDENNYFSKKIDEKKIFFQIRNHTHFNRNFITNKIIYYSNMFIFLFYFALRNFFIIKDKFFFFKRLYLIVKAVKSGDNKKLISYQIKF